MSEKRDNIPVVIFPNKENDPSMTQALTDLEERFSRGLSARREQWELKWGITNAGNQIVGGPSITVIPHSDSSRELMQAAMQKILEERRASLLAASEKRESARKQRAQRIENAVARFGGLNGILSQNRSPGRESR